jgi:proteasome accessory factor B
MAVHRLERLLNLVAALLETPRPLTADELRQRVPGYADDQVAFRRAFERDKETLREMGIPVAVEPLDRAAPEGAVGYRIRREEYELPDLGLEADELAALHLAATTVRLEGAQGAEALWKLGGAVAEGGPVAAVAALPGEEELAPLFGAVAARQTVTFRYRGEERTVDPWRLSFRNGHWYVAGFDRSRSAERLYRVDRIESVPVLGPPGSAEVEPAPPRPPAPPWQTGGDEEVVAHLLVDADQAGWAIGQLGPDAVKERRPDGAVVLALRVTNRAAFRSFVLGFLEHAEVLEPDELRAEVVTWLEGLCRR